ncbi:hypothetical protein [Acidovorax kalamii]|uniref:hypothetical protein n=1 Tax=Acidovorax kalamii TaxID=2004485 RepID=UPI0020912F7B|nr:hypothetical protein [Acidovorax kalamii]MCO5357900.1 hypothetical protein [Acidovorax kalamii]
MQAHTVLKKTDQGIEAIKHRDRALAPRERTTLILVDGSKRLQDLAQACGGLDEALRIGQALVDLGLASVVSGGAAAPSPAAAAGDAPAAAAAAAQPQDLRSSTRRATKALEDLLGPACEPLALQLEKCKSMAELQAKILELRTVVASMRSEKKAEEFVAAALGR